MYRLLQASFYLLIVPYGIETGIGYDAVADILCLLIVPYGIETLHGAVAEEEIIETFNRTLWN